MFERAESLDQDIRDYGEFLRKHRKRTRPTHAIQVSEGRSVEAYGPFKVFLSIGPTPVWTKTYVTSDPKFDSDFALGRDDWPIMMLKTVHSRVDEEESAAHVLCEGPHARTIRTLIDTGTGPNVLSLRAFLGMGYTFEDLEPSRHRVSLIHDPTIITEGHFSRLEIRLADTRLEISCAVVDGMESDELILGREFLVKYDVLLDIPRNCITMRNPHMDDMLP